MTSPGCIQELAAIAGSLRATAAIWDGEIAVLDAAGWPRLERIQPRIQAFTDRAVRQLTRSRPAVFFAFDLFALNSRDLRGLPRQEPRRRLEAALDPGPSWRLSKTSSEGANLLTAARAQGLEAIVAKQARSVYASARHPEWLKIKTVHEEDFAIAGSPPGERDDFGALLVGIRDAPVFLEQRPGLTRLDPQSPYRRRRPGGAGHWRQPGPDGLLRAAGMSRSERLGQRPGLARSARLPAN